MALWVDKYRPKHLVGDNALDYHIEQAKHLKCMIDDNCLPHLLFVGPSGAGKKTRIKCLLRELYGSGADRTQLLVKPFTTPSNRKLEIQTVSSNYHIELTPSDVGIYDRVVIQDIVKEMAQTSQIDVNAQRPFKVVVLCEADQLTKDAQHGLRRTMEKYANNCRIILCCDSLSKIIDPLQSRCIVVNVPSPSDEDVSRILQKICAKEKVTIPDNVLRQILLKADRNLRRAILMAETTRMISENGIIHENAKVPLPEWEIYLQDTAKMIIQRQTNDCVLKVRERLYEVLSRCIPPNIVLNKLLDFLLPSCPDIIVGEVVAEAVKFEHRMLLGQKAIYHLEAFVIAFMDIYLTNASKPK